MVGEGGVVFGLVGVVVFLQEIMEKSGELTGGFMVVVCRM